MVGIAGVVASAAWGQAAPRPGTYQPTTLMEAVLSTFLFGFIGIVLAIIGFKLFDMVIPFALEAEICERQNLAVAILSGAMILGICIIVATAVL
jgi:uncharacterized membrane protein YjfL (UPF0719 family)